jgi:16S rRNA (guanine966-N2)-methyltransferase
MPGRLRIVGGVHRGRKLPVPDQPGLRPTADRVRETLFNWLAPVIQGARCLDLFAGSGALGFEAASRGAAEVVMIERAAAVARVLSDNARTLGAAEVQVIRADALAWLDGQGRPFDIAFLDPPFDADLLAPACALLARNGWLAPGARIYLEAPAKPGLPPLPAGWVLLRDKQAGRVCYALAEAGAESAALA